MRRALLVGINHYEKNPLQGCIPDAERMQEVIARHENYEPNFDCQLMVSNEDNYNVTIPRLKQKLHDLFNYEADVAFFFFAGHGASTDLGSYLVTEDGEKHNEGVSLSEVVTMANNSKATEVIIILDCCYSGGIGNFAELGDRKVILREGVSLLTGSRDTQYSMERGGYGVFTTIIYDALKGGAADILGKVNVARLYNYVDIMLDSWDQRPVFKSHVSKMIPLRNCTPKIPSETLRNLSKYFHGSKKGIQLSKDYIAGEEVENGLTSVMSDLRQYHANGLLLPEKGIVSLDECAKKDKACVLTPLGEYYKDLVNNNRI
jgi:hypothetical protein